VSGRRPGCSSSSGGRGCSPTTSSTGSSGSGSRPTASWRNPPLGGERSGRNPTDRGKQGVKRSLLCDGTGVPLAIEAAGANVRDEKLLRATIEAIPIERPDSPQLEVGLCLDKGFDYREVYELLDEFGFTAHVLSRRQEADQIKREAGYRARRWVVERTHSWLNRFRRLLVRWEKHAHTYLAMLHLACAVITWRAVISNPLPK
jgi:putative transposase